METRLSDLAKETLVRIEGVISQYKNPAIAASFGKDSLILVDLLSHLNLPIICHRPAFQAERWKFALRFIEDKGLKVYDWPAMATYLQEQDGNLELISAYNLGDSEESFAIGQKIINNPDMPRRQLVCGLYDCLQRPRSRIEGVWDLLIIGHKNGDPNHLGDNLTVTEDIKQGKECDIYMPLRNWTEANVYNYISWRGLPVDLNRYWVAGFDGQEVLQELDDKSKNPDYIEGCFACVDRCGKNTVKCPRLFGAEVNNVSNRITYIPPRTKL